RDDYELTRSAILVGVILGIIFGASSLYLVLRVGMTVSASIPVAVLSITLFRALSEKFGFRRATILENNIVQTTGSAGESIAFGVGVTMPAVMILGYDLEITRVMLVACLGGLLGILMMIPLRRAFIVEQHDTLKYPEGTACAKVLEVGEAGGSSARTVFTGFGIAFFYQIAMQAMHLWKEVPSRAIGWLKGGVVACEVSPALLGVGYIIGPRVAAVMIGGGILAALVLTPMIAFFGSNAPGAIFPGDKPIPAMSSKEIRDAYILYIGAGAVAAGGIISMIQALPMIFASIRSGLKDIRGGGKSVDSANPRDRDLPLTFVIGGSLLLVAIISGSHLIPTELPGRIAGAIMILLFGFLFVTVSSRLTGEIGSSSNPISGMTVATLLLTCLVFVLAGWVGPEYRLAALSIAGIVCVAASNGGTTSQDLKTGYLVGATPAYQQIAILAGALSSAIVIGFTLLLLNKASTVVTAKPEYLPKINAPNVAALTETEQGPDGQKYKVWRVLKPKPDVAAGKYLVDDTGKPKYLVDPAINGRVNKRDDGSDVVKFDAPKASLMALIIDGVLQGDLPWGLVAIGVLISVVLQLCGVPALAFAVGVYLPLSASAPIFVGGLVRLVCDRRGPKYAEGQ
ncbi:MAG: OPT family oligopeptide transporter, partial [Isosphaeraceae bacterium]